MAISQILMSHAQFGGNENKSLFAIFEAAEYTILSAWKTYILIQIFCTKSENFPIYLLRLQAL